MILSRDIRNIEEYVSAYIEVWNGFFGMTEKEKAVLHAFLEILIRHKQDGLQDKYIYKLLFSTESRKEVREKLGNISEQGLNNYINQLKEKGVILGEGKTLQIEPTLIPKKEITFRFNFI